MPRDSEFFADVVQAPARFSAYACAEGPTHLQALPRARTIADAAMDFAELWHGDEPQVRVVVLDGHNGREECFTIDLG
jgi:hypothetical protein